MSISNIDAHQASFLKAAFLNLDIPNDDPIVQIESHENGPNIVITSEPEAPPKEPFKSPPHHHRTGGILSPDGRFNPFTKMHSLKQSNNILSLSSIPGASPYSSGENTPSPSRGKNPNYIMKDIFNSLSPTADKNNVKNDRKLSNKNLLSPIQQYFGVNLSPRVEEKNFLHGKTPDVDRSFEGSENNNNPTLVHRRSFGFESRNYHLEGDENHTNNEDIEKSYEQINSSENTIEKFTKESFNQQQEDNFNVKTINPNVNISNNSDNPISNNVFNMDYNIYDNSKNNSNNNTMLNNQNKFNTTQNNNNINNINNSQTNSNSTNNSSSFCNNNYSNFNIMYNINTINTINLNTFQGTNNPNYMNTNFNFSSSQFNPNQNIVQHNYPNQTKTNFYHNNNNSPLMQQNYNVNKYMPNYSQNSHQQFINMPVYNQGFYLNPQNQQTNTTNTNNNNNILNTNNNQTSFRQNQPQQQLKNKKPHRIGSSMNLHKMDYNEIQKQCHNLAKDQIGCRFLQKKIEEDTKFALESLYPIILDHLLDTINDQFGNYLIQKFIEYLNEEQLTQLLQMISPSFTIIGLHQFGTRVIQKIVEHVKNDSPDNTLFSIYSRLIKENFICFCNDINGCHIIQKVLSVNNINNSFVFDELDMHIDKISNDKNGCCFIQKCLEKLTGKDLERLLNAVHNKIKLLLLNQYGNYVIQHVMKINGKKRNNATIQLLIDDLVFYSNQKYSSSIIEKYLVSDDSMKKDIVVKLLSPGVLKEILFDVYGNYVIQKALSLCDNGDRYKLLTVIASLINELKTLNFGLKLLNKLTNSYPELVTIMENLGCSVGIINNSNNNNNI